MAVGLSSSATITINVDVKGESLEELRRSMQALGKAVNTKETQRQIDNLQKEMRELREETKEAAAETKRQANVMSAAQTKAANEIAEANARASASEKKAADTARTAAANRKNAYNQGAKAAEDAFKRRSNAGKKGAATAKKNEAARVKAAKAMQKAIVQTYKSATAAQKRYDAELNKSVNNIKKSVAATEKAKAAKEKEKAALQRAVIYLQLYANAQDKASQETREAEIRTEQAAQAERERADRMRMYAGLFDQIAAKEKKSTDTLKRQAEIGEMITRIGKKRAAAVKEQTMAETRRARQLKLLAFMEKQGGDYLKRNEKLYNSLKNATRLNRQELQRYTRAVRESVSAQKAHNAQLRGKSGKGFMNDLRYNLSHYEQQMDAIFRASFRMQMVGNNLKMFARDIYRYGTQIMDTFGEYEFMLNRAAGALEIWRDSTIDGVKGTDLLSQSVLNAADEVMLFPAQEIAESLYYWGSATGQVVRNVNDLEVAMGSMIPIMKVAAMTNTGYEETVKGVYSVLTQFYKGQLEYAPEVTKTLFFITQKTAAEFKDLISSFKMVGPVAAQVGVTFQEVAGIFGRLSDLGLRASMSGRGFRQLFIQLLRPSGPAKKKLDELWNSPGVQMLYGGKSFQETVFEGGKFIGMENYMKTLYQATQAMEDYEKQAFLARISTANSLPIITALVADYGRELQGLKDVQDNKLITDAKVNEFFQENWNLLSNSWKAISGSVKRSIERIILVAGGGIAEAITPFMNSLKELANRFRDFIELNPQVVAMFSKMAAALAAVAAVGGVLFTITGALSGLGAAVYLVINSFKPWFGALGAAVAMLTLLFDAVVRNADYIRKQLVDAVEVIQDAFSDWTEETGGLTETIENMRSVMEPVFDVFVTKAADMVKAIADLVAWVIKMDTHLGGLVSGTLATFMAIFLSSKLIAGVIMFGKAMMFAAGAKMVRAWTVMRRQVIVTTAAVRGLTKATRLFSIAGGPIMWIALAASLLLIGDVRIPVVSDAVDNLARNFEDLNKTMDETISKFGVFDYAAEKMADSTAQNIMGDRVNFGKMKEYGELYAPELNLGAWTDANTQAMSDVMMDGGEPAEIMRKNLLDQSNTIKQRISIYIGEHFDRIASDTNDALIREGRQGIDKQKFMGTMEKVRIFADIPEFLSESMAINYANEVQRLLTMVPDVFGAGEAKTIYQSVENALPNLTKNLDFGEFFHLFSDRVSGVFTADAQEDFAPASEKMADMLGIETSLALAQAMTDVELVDGQTIAQIVNNPQLPEQIQRLAEAVYQRLDFLIAEEAGATDAFSLENATKALKEAYTQSVNNIFVKSFAGLEEIVYSIQDLALLGDAQAMAEGIVDLIDSQLPDETLLKNALKSTELPDEFKKAVLPFIQDAFDLTGDPELQSIIESIEDSAEEAAGDAVDHWTKGFVEGMGQEVDRAELKKLAKMGTVREQIAEIWDRGKDRAAAFYKGGSIQSKKEWNQRVLQEQQAALDAIRNSKPKQLEKRMRAFLIGGLKTRGEMGANERKNLIAGIMDLGEINPDMVWKIVKKQLPKGSTLRARIKKQLFGKEEEGGEGKEETNWLQPSIENALSTLNSVTIQNQSKQIGTDISIGADTGVQEFDWAPTGVAAIGGVAAAMTAANVVGGAVDLAAQSIGEMIATGMRTGVTNETSVGKIQAGIKRLVILAKAGIDLSTNGHSVGVQFAQGVEEGISSYSINVTGNFIATTKANSPPKKGVLKDIDKWGLSAGQSYAKSVGKGISQGFKSDQPKLAGMEIKRSNKKEIIVKLEVSSPDGTANRQKQGEIRRGALDALTVMGLEHYMTVG